MRQHLLGLEKEALADLLLGAAESDDALSRRLYLSVGLNSPSLGAGSKGKTKRGGGGGHAKTGPDLTALRHFLRTTLAFDRDEHGGSDYDDGYWYDESEAEAAYVERGQEVFPVLEGLLTDGHADAVVGLAEFAVKEIFDARQEGENVALEAPELVERLRDLHHRACRAADPAPEPRALAGRLLELTLDDPEAFADAGTRYADVLGAAGPAALRQETDACWHALPSARTTAPRGGGSGRKSPSDDFMADYARQRERAALKTVLEFLARAQGDTDALVALKRRDLSRATAYLDLAQTLFNAGRADDALAAAAEGNRAFPYPDPRDPARGGQGMTVYSLNAASDPTLQGFLAAQYHARGRHDDALALIWPRFTWAANRHAHGELRRHAERADAWPAWREKALAHLRATLPKGKASIARRDRSPLVEILLSEEKDPDAAWQEARIGDCTQELWLRLAKAREADHPEDALEVYRRDLEKTIQQTNRDAYATAVGWLTRISILLRRLGRAAEFDALRADLRVRHGKKRNFVKLLDEKKL